MARVAPQGEEPQTGDRHWSLRSARGRCQGAAKAVEREEVRKEEMTPSPFSFVTAGISYAPFSTSHKAVALSTRSMTFTAGGKAWLIRRVAETRGAAATRRAAALSQAVGAPSLAAEPRVARRADRAARAVRAPRVDRVGQVDRAVLAVEVAARSLADAASASVEGRPTRGALLSPQRPTREWRMEMPCLRQIAEPR